MSNPLQGINFDRVHQLMIAIALAAFLGAMFADKMLIAGIAAGVMTFGVGEVANHQPRETWFTHGKITSRTRLNTPMGVFLCGIGLIMTGWFVYRALVE